MRASGARWGEARALNPAGEYGDDEWRQHFTDHPDVLMQVLGDVFRIYKGEEQKRNGTANPQGGRRKSHINGSLDELWAIVTPRFAVVPFPEAFKELQGKRTLRAFALKAGMDHRDLSRKLRGKVPITRYDLERMAKCLDVHPAYFAEWRTMMVTDALTHVLTSSPHLSIRALRALS